MMHDAHDAQAHAQALQAASYKLQAASCKLQAQAPSTRYKIVFEQNKIKAKAKGMRLPIACSAGPGAQSGAASARDSRFAFCSFASSSTCWLLIATNTWPG
jgi:hypothetical protein